MKKEKKIKNIKQKRNILIFVVVIIAIVLVVFGLIRVRQEKNKTATQIPDEIREKATSVKVDDMTVEFNGIEGGKQSEKH